MPNSYCVCHLDTDSKMDKQRRWKLAQALKSKSEALSKGGGDSIPPTSETAPTSPTLHPPKSTSNNNSPNSTLSNSPFALTTPHSGHPTCLGRNHCWTSPPRKSQRGGGGSFWGWRWVCWRTSLQEKKDHPGCLLSCYLHHLLKPRCWLAKGAPSKRHLTSTTNGLGGWNWNWAHICSTTCSRTPP